MLVDNVKTTAIKCGRKPHDITILAVSKTHSAEKMAEAANCGVRIFGESRIQEAIPKINIIKNLYPDTEFHYIGKLQTNKAKKLVEHFSLIHSVDREDAAEALNKAAYSIGKVQNILIQLNLADEPQKNGVLPANIDKLVSFVSDLPNIKLCGFMLIPPFDSCIENNIIYFKEAKNIFEKYKSCGINILSMGMSGDYETAIIEGSTMVRVGTIIFGDR